MPRIIADGPPAGNAAGPESVRSDPAPADARPPAGNRSDNQVGYAFDAIPQALKRDGDLLPIDHVVIEVLVMFAFRGGRRDSCWASVKQIASQISRGNQTVSERTVQRSIGRLKRRWLDHRPTPKPDPDAPKNRTGWRFHFRWFGNGKTVPEPAGAIPTIIPTPPAGAVTAVSPPTPPEAGGVTSVLHQTIVGQVTRMSGDTTVTQIQIPPEKKKEPTACAVNVPAKTDPGAVAVATVTPTATATERHTHDYFSEWEEKADGIFNPERLEQARRLRAALESHSRGLTLELTAEGVIRAIKRQRPGYHIEDLSSDELAKCKDLKPELLHLLVTEARVGVDPPATTPVQPPATKVPAPPVSRAEAEMIQEMIGQLLDAPDETMGERFAAALVAAFREEDPETSYKTYRGWAQDVRRRSWPATILSEAFDEACSPKGRVRGAMMVKGVQKRLKARHSGPAITASGTTRNGCGGPHA